MTFFENGAPAVEIIDVLEFHHKNDVHSVDGRPFHALSYRIEADTTIECRGESHHVTGGMLAYFPANLSYRRTTKREHSIVVHFRLFNQQTDGLEIITPDNQEGIKSCFEKMLAVPSPAKGAGCRLAELFYRALRFATGQDGECDTQSPLADIGDYIAENFRNPALTVAELASRAFMSEVTFRKYFMRQFGSTPKEYILALRFSYAQSLLRTHEFRVGEVATLSGFAGEKHFSTLFKKRYGISPSRY